MRPGRLGDRLRHEADGERSAAAYRRRRSRTTWGRSSSRPLRRPASRASRTASSTSSRTTASIAAPRAPSIPSEGPTCAVVLG
ncbi:hypothetical protein ASF46_13045 [Rathayibacter sp. Leaf296]|nr:hypothetical protein ASF46_13045 [Rathayibacter sp. Leaf296]